MSRQQTQLANGRKIENKSQRSSKSAEEVESDLKLIILLWAAMTQTRKRWQANLQSCLGPQSKKFVCYPKIFLSFRKQAPSEDEQSEQPKSQPAQKLALRDSKQIEANFVVLKQLGLWKKKVKDKKPKTRA